MSDIIIFILISLIGILLLVILIMLLNLFLIYKDTVQLNKIELTELTLKLRKGDNRYE